MATAAVKTPYIEAAAPATPSAGQVVIYSKSDGLMYSKDDAGTETLMSGGAGGGSVATDAIWDAAGDLVQGTGANTAAKLSAGTAGNFLKSAGAAAANVWAFPPGHELDYVEVTSDVSVTTVDGGGFDTVVSGTSQAYANEAILIEFYANAVQPPGTASNNYLYFALFDGGTQLGNLTIALIANSASGQRYPVMAKRRLTPTAATHQYIVKAAIGASGTGTVRAGNGTSGAAMPCFIRITKV
jgi:hypothetical protein